MTEECRYQITSNEYADFIVDYYSDYNNLRRFNTDCYNIINNKYAVIHLPVSVITKGVIQEYGYYTIPSCYGLLQTSSLEETGVNRIQSIPAFALRGQGVLIGIIDTGIEYTNNVFKNANNTTRILSIWDQTIDSESYPEGFFYGTEYSREQINEALSSQNPLEIVPSTDENGHGTTIAGIAAGSANEENNFRGVVPDAEFVIVKLKEAKEYLRQFFFIPEDVPCYQKNDIMFGVKYVNEIATKVGRPIAICIALGTNQGGHDGRDALSDFLSDIGDETGNVVVVGAGNEGSRGHHYFATIDRTIGYDNVELSVGENEYGFTMELWGYAPNTYTIDILSPTGEYIPRIPARNGESRVIQFIFENTIVFVDYRIVEEQSGDELIIIRFQKPTAGIWHFKVYGRGDINLDFHIWLPVHNFIGEDTTFIRPSPDTTITGPGNAILPITVTAYNHITGGRYMFASRGYTRTGLIKPNIGAPGVELIGPTINGGFIRSSGTSLSAAFTTGVVAMMLEWGIVKENYISMNTTEVNKFLIRGANRSNGLTYPNREWGYGKIDIYNTFEVLRSV